MSALRMAVWSSATIFVATIENFRRLSTSTTAGPERSARSPRAEESLTVRTAAVTRSGIEEDIVFFFFLRLHFALVALGFVEQA